MRLRGLFVVAGLIALIACGGDTPAKPVTPTPTPTPKAIVKVLIDPQPIVAVASGNSEFPWSFAVNLQVSDSGGVGFTVTSMQTTVVAKSTGQVIASLDQNAFVGVKVAPLGQSTRQFQAGAYRMDSNKTKEGTFSVSLNLVDDNGFASVANSSAVIQHLGRAVELPQ